MDSMKRNEANNSSHHQSKVVLMKKVADSKDERDLCKISVSEAISHEQNNSSRGSGSARCSSETILTAKSGSKNKSSHCNSDNVPVIGGRNNQLHKIPIPKAAASIVVFKSPTDPTTSQPEKNISDSRIGAISAPLAVVSDIKDSNFDDDNEWDVGIGDLIIDLDADIEKTGSNQLQQHQQQPNQLQQQAIEKALSKSIQTSEGAGGLQLPADEVLGCSGIRNATSTTKNTDNFLASGDDTGSSLTAELSLSEDGNIAPGSVAANTSSSNHCHNHQSDHHRNKHILLSGRREGDSSFKTTQQPVSNSPTTIALTATTVDCRAGDSDVSTESNLLQLVLTANQTDYQKQVPNANSGIEQHIFSIGNVRGKVGTSQPKTNNETTLGSNIITMSSTTSSSSSKSTTKLSVDHQATLDKGLKMKIKRTKPGTKTSEAKHEIVKSDQNGTTPTTATLTCSSGNSISGASSVLGNALSSHTTSTSGVTTTSSSTTQSSQSIVVANMNVNATTVAVTHSTKAADNTGMAAALNTSNNSTSNNSSNIISNIAVTNSSANLGTNVPYVVGLGGGAIVAGQSASCSNNANGNIGNPGTIGVSSNTGGNCNISTNSNSCVVGTTNSSGNNSKKHSSQSITNIASANTSISTVGVNNANQQQSMHCSSLHTSQQQAQLQTSNKRSSSSHRRDKGKDKATHHNQRDKSEQLSQQHQQQHQSEQQQQQPQQQQQQQQQKQQPQQQQQQQQPQQQQQQQPQQQQQQQQNQPEQQQDEQQEQQQPQPHPAQQQQQQQIQPQQQTQQQQQQSQQPQPQLPRSHQQPHHHHHNHSHQQHHSVSEDGASSGNSNHSSVISSSSCICSAYDGQVNGLLQQQQPPCSSTSCIYSKNMLGEDSGPNTDTTLIATQRLSKIGGGTGANNNTSVMNTVGSPSASSTVNSNNNTLSGSGQPLFVKDVCKMINAASSGIASQNTISPSVNSNMGITGGNSSYTANSTNSKVHLQNSLQQGIDDVSSNKANSTNMIVSSGMFLASVGTSASPGLHTQDGKMYGSSPPPAKRHKGDRKDMVDVCVGTSVGTITEPDCLGPCEPGTSVTLEGIVWHETEGGVLVVNVTWRGKTYVGTLIDCTKHDWAPPRFCDSPTEELDSRTPKGRGKRGRSSALLPSNDLSNFTETRSSMHSKLRNGGTKGRGGRGGVIEPNSTKLQAATAGSNALPSGNNASCAAIIGSNNTPSTSPIAFLPPRAEKRKSKDEPPSAHAAGYGSGTGFIAGGESLAVSSNATVGNNVISPTNASTGNSSDNVLNTGPNNGSCGDGMIASGTQYAIDGSVVGLNISVGGAAISVSKKSKVSTSPCAISPVLLECPEQDCSKKYKHANGLKYHQSHAHGGSASSMDEDSLQAPESPQPTKTPPPLPVTSESRGAVGPCSGPQSNLQTGDLLLNPETSALAVSSNSELVLALPATTTTAGDQNSSILTAVSSTASVSTVQSGTASSISTSSSQLSQQSIGSKSSQTMLATAAQVACNATPSLKDGENIAAHTIGGILLQPSHTSADQKGTKTNASELNDNIDSNGAIDTNMGMISLKDEVDVSAKLGIGGSNNRLSASVTTLLSGSNAGDATKAPSNYVKQKKMRKSPGPSEYDAVTTSASNRTEDVQSPAYSDISDDSSPVTDLTDMPVNSGEGSEKSKGSHVAETSATRKSNDGDDGVNGASNSNSSVGPLGQLAGYGLYPFYSGLPHQQPPTPGGSYFQSAPDLGSGRPPPPAPSATISTVVSHNIPTSIAVPATASSSGAIEYTKNKEPPLDLINKPGAGCSSQLSLHQPQMASSLSAPPTLTPGSTASSTDVTRGMPMNSPAMGIQHQGDIKDASILSAGPLSTPPGSKVLQHYYPYGYVASGYSYPGLDAGYGSLSVMTEESKHNSIGTVKEERFKESQGTSEYNKLTATPVMATKMSKSESLKDIKTESGLSVGAHQGSGVLTKEQSLTSLNSQPPPPPLPSQPLGPYGSMFQRHGLNTASPTGGPPPPPPSHMATRDEELRRLFSYSEQRRVSSGGSNGPPSGHPITTGLIPKEEPHSPSSHTPQSQQQQHSLHGQSMLAVNLPGGKSSKSSSSSLQSTSSTSVKGMGKSSDGTSIKLQQDEKESNVKVKQEGQKPTMETQGPPPPPTSQYYSPSLYMSAAPFGFDPNHQMYRQMLVSTAPYSASPYHLQIPRFNHPPEDLSRNQSTKALDLLQHHANQYYNSHKIHELGERALKSPTSSTVKVSVSNSNLSQQASCQTPNLCIPPPNNSSTGLSLQQQSVAVAQQQQISSSNSTSTGGGLGTSVVSSVGGGGGSSSGSGGSSGNSSSGGGGVGGAVGGGSGGSVSGGVPPALQQASSQQQPINTAGTHMQGSSLNNNGPGNSASGVNNGNGSTGISSGGGSGAKDCTHSVDHHGNTSGSNSQQQPSATSGQSMTGSGNSNVRSPPPQRHVHTHHHTHVGLGYPMFQAPYGAVLASPQATAVTVLSPFQTGPTAK